MPNPYKYLDATKRWRKENKQHIRRKQLKRLYNLTQEQFDDMYAEQKGMCAICGEPGKLFVDHDHATCEVRGLLCNLCNVGLGFFKEDPVRLTKAVEYIA